jgi:hypothetical protein
MNLKDLHRCRNAGVVLLAVLLLAPPPATAGDDPSPPVRIPHLGEHVFVPDTYIPEPFVATQLRTSVGMGQAVDFQTSLLIIDGKPVLGLKGDLLFAILGFEYQNAIKDWIAIRARTQVSGRLGTGVQTLLSEGVTAAMGFDFGWLFRLRQGDRSLLSGSIEFGNHQTTAISISGFVKDIIAGVDASLVRTSPSMRGSGGLRYAHGFSELIGMGVSGDVGYGESPSRARDDSWFYRIGAKVDFNLRYPVGVPLGFVTGAQYESAPQDHAEFADGVYGLLLRIAYTGTDDLAVGLQLTFERVPTHESDQNLRFNSANFDMRYFF